MKLLYVDSSVLGARSVSRELSDAVVRAWRQAQPDANVVYRDLAATVRAHITPAAVETLKFGAPPAAGTEKELALCEDLLSEFLAADGVVIGTPM